MTTATKTKVEVKRTVELDDEFMECLVEMAGYGINYWCDAAIVDEEAGTYHIHLSEPVDDDAPMAYLLTYQMLADALAKIVTGEIRVNDEIRNDASEALWQQDAGYVDSIVGDCVTQVAAFNEIVFG